MRSNRKKFVLFVMALLPLMAAGCFGQRARDSILSPALTSIAPRVVEDASTDPAADSAKLAIFSAAITEKRYADANALWPQVEAWGTNGITAQVAAGRIGEAGAKEKRERLARFGADLAKAARQ